jgi:hypothetical protein
VIENVAAAQTPRVNLIAAGLAAYFLSVIAASHGL